MDETIIAITAGGTPGDSSHSAKRRSESGDISQRRIAKEVGISQSEVHKILKEADLKPPQDCILVWKKS
ncbi:MAG: winged helix-turn-helix transcriptional regulator [Bacteroidia bacterium]